MAKAFGSIDKTASFPEWQYKVTIKICGGARMSFDVLLVNQEFEEKFKLKELLQTSFNIKIVQSNLISDILFPKTNLQFVFDNEKTVKSGQILLVSMADPRIPDLSMLSLDQGFKMKMYRDRFDLADLIVHLTKPNPRTNSCDPLKLISFMTWDRHPLPLSDCQTVLNHFKSVENMFKLSKEAIEFSINALEISKKSKQHILIFLTSNQNYYID